MPYLPTIRDSEEGLYMYSAAPFPYSQDVPLASTSSTQQPQSNFYKYASGFMTSAVAHNPPNSEFYDSSPHSYPSRWTENLDDSPLSAPRTPPESYAPEFMDSWNQAQRLDIDAFHLPFSIDDMHHAIEQPCHWHLYSSHVLNLQNTRPSSPENAVMLETPAQHVQSPDNRSPTIHHPQPVRPIPIISLSALSAAETSQSRSQQVPVAESTPLLFRPVSPAVIAQHYRYTQREDTSHCHRRMSYETEWHLSLPSPYCVQWPVFSHL